MALGRWKLAAAGVVLVLAAGVTACDWPIRPSFTVTSADTAGDAAPGDGVCETAPGNGTCTLAAALDEANASGVDTDLVVPTGDYAAVDVVVTGRVRINEGLTNRIAVRQVHVVAGGQLIADGLAQFLPDGPVQVDGVLVLRHSALGGLGTQLRVGATGVAGLENVTVDVGFGAAIENDGRVWTRNVTMSLFNLSAGPVLRTGTSASTTLESTVLSWRAVAGSPQGAPAGSACGGTPPVSLGANIAWDQSCGLVRPDDLQGSNVTGSWDQGGVSAPYFTSIVPDAGSPSIDAIAVGTHGCGNLVVDDQRGDPRPVDADGDGVTPAACDIGAIERQTR